jgi:ABC-type Fe3+-hydroxamate transport system substrate-binding protein
MSAMRVVSLLPSGTEILCEIGGGSLLVGRSHECDFPAMTVKDVPVLTAARTRFESSAQVDRDVRAAMGSNASLYSLDAARLAELCPDVIITQDLCEVCSIDLETVRRVAAGMANPPRIVSLNPHTFEDVLDDHLRVGEAVGLVREAEEAVVRLRGRMYAAMDYVPNFAASVVTVFLEWTDPLFVGGHWTPQLIERAGGAHPLNPTTAVEDAGAAAGPIGQSLRKAGKSIRVPWEAVAAVRPEVVIVSPCGLGLEQAVAEAQKLGEQAWWRELEAVKRGRVAVVDGNQMFSRPGPRLVDGFEFLVGILNDRPEVVPTDFPWRWLGGTR